MPQVVLDFDSSAFSALRASPEEFAREVKLAAVLQWYAEGRISQSKAGEMLGIGRVELLDELYRRGIPASQVTPAEIREDALGG